MRTGLFEHWFAIREPYHNEASLQRTTQAGLAGLQNQIKLAIRRMASSGGAGGTGTTDHALDFCATCGANTNAAAGLARLLIELASSHLSLDSGVFDQFSKPFDCIIDRLVITQPQLDHTVLPSGLLKVFGLIPPANRSQRRTPFQRDADSNGGVCEWEARESPTLIAAKTPRRPALPLDANPALETAA